MMINLEEVKRDEYGYWTHSQYPSCENYDGWKAILDKFQQENDITVHHFMLDDDGSEQGLAASEKYWGTGYADISAYDPVIPSGSFLLSIHDTEDGPCVVYATPNWRCGK